MQDIILTVTSDKVLNSLVYMDHLSASSYSLHELQTVKNGPVFMAWINEYFRFSVVSLILCKEYLNMATFRISVLLQMNILIERRPTSSYTEVINI